MANSIPPPKSGTPDESHIYLTSLGVTKLLSLIMVFLVVMDVIRLYLKNNRVELVQLNNYLDDHFKITGEFNFPTLFSSFLLLLSGLILLLLFMRTKTNQYRYHWLVLGLIFIFLSLDEALMIHESASRLIRSNFKVEGSIQYGTWSVPYTIITAIIGLIYLRFLWHLPSTTRLLFIVSGFIFVMGAAGLELLEGYYFFNHGENSVLYRLVHWTQEILEMVGIIIFVYALLDYLGKMNTKIAIKNTFL